MRYPFLYAASPSYNLLPDKKLTNNNNYYCMSQSNKLLYIVLQVESIESRYPMKMIVHVEALNDQKKETQV